MLQQIKSIVEVISEKDNIKKIIFNRSNLYIIWNDNTASIYQYQWIENIQDTKLMIGGIS